MNQKTTEGVSIYVNTYYNAEHEHNTVGNLFSYEILIENKSDHVLKLISRHWYIFDGNGDRKEVVGDGVVGLQPILQPGNSFQYTSHVILKSDVGAMHGTYLFQNLFNKKSITVEIPRFTLLHPIRKN